MRNACDLYKDNYKNFIGEIKEDQNKWRHTMFLHGKTNIVKMSNHLHVNLQI